MIKTFIYKIFGTRNERLLKNYAKSVVKINFLEPEMAKLTDAQLQAKTIEFKQRYSEGETLSQLLIEAFAVCREASKRTLNMRHFDVQLIGGMVLNDGKIAEMRTGEGKTLVATLPVYLNSIAGMGVHVVTVNDYLAKRDANDLSKLYEFLGLTVGVNLADMSQQDKTTAYLADVTYGTNNEFGFDYLRDNMVFDLKDKVQRPLSFAIVDEVDSILIDEARTPLIISGPAEGTDELYVKLNKVPPLLTIQSSEDSKEGDFWVDEKNHNVVLSELGHENVEKLLVDMGILQKSDSLYHVHNISLMHHLLSSLKAHYVYHKDQHYVVQNGEVIIVDEFTGRLMHGRRWSDGLHQAVEAKEGVKIQRENQTMATITFQNYFRMYKKLAGMTGTADTEAYEFQQIYNLETVVIPTNRPMIRIDYNDKIYMHLEDKYKAVVEDIKQCHANGQPVLVGTTSVENSEILSRLLTQAKLKHAVLNAKQHAKEADIIVQAGQPGAITVATNMAGRGTDIILGGNFKPEILAIKTHSTLKEEHKQPKIDEVMSIWQERNHRVLKAGGLHIIGTERHESRRIDNQLRGRSGRQGDYGSSRFYLSLEDPLLRIFGGERMRSMMQRLGMDKGESIEHKWLSRSIESAQRKVEGHNFDIRKQLLEYDDVSNEQCRVIYQQRDEILASLDLSEMIMAMFQGVLRYVFELYIPHGMPIDEWDIVGLEKKLKDEYLFDYSIQLQLDKSPKIDIEVLKENMVQAAYASFESKMQIFVKQVAADIDVFINNTIIGESRASWNMAALDEFCLQNGFLTDITFTSFLNNHLEITRSEVIELFKRKIGDAGKIQMLRFEKSVLIQHIDHYWREHLTQLEQLRQGIHLRGYAQKDPKQEYKQEAFSLFSTMLYNIKSDVTKVLLTIKLQSINDMMSEVHEDDNATEFIHTEATHLLSQHPTQHMNVERPISRNSPCFCGSGKKYKHCHGKLI